MLTWNEEEARVEASLGGRVTAAEVNVLAEELQDVIEELDTPFLLLLDYSRAQALDDAASEALCALKDFCLDNGAEKIVSVVFDEEQAARHIDHRLQLVLEGREAIVAQGSEAQHLRREAVIYDLNEIRKAA